MSTEIELKYQLPENTENTNAVVENITAMLKSCNLLFEMNQNQLVNDYFDNDNLDLRKMDCGLRIRTKNNQCEQTIKTAGKVIGCLHQRPEYNVDIATNKLNLSLFPKDIWPENVNVINLQQSLKVIFSTNFLRKTWLIHQNENVIELALDTGNIGTDLGKETVLINEIEIELVSGNEQALFDLAKKLMTVVVMEPSEVSKAARGYALFYAQNGTDKTNRIG
jgi:triphosphatase